MNSNNSQLDEAIRNYNDLVKEWNRQYGNICEGMPIEKSEIETGLATRIQSVFSNEMSGRMKLSNTKTVMGDFSKLPQDAASSDDLTKGELAYCIVEAAKSVEDKI